MNLKQKYEEVKTKIARHPNCVAAIGSMLITGAALGYYTGKELSKAQKRNQVFDSFLGDLSDGEKHAVWLDVENRKFYVQTLPLSEEDL